MYISEMMNLKVLLDILIETGLTKVLFSSHPPGLWAVILIKMQSVQKESM